MEVDINQIQPNKYNPKITEENLERYEAIKAGIQEMGMKSPIDVREIEGTVPYEIIDGYHRWKACQELGWKTIPISSWGKIDEVVAKKITILKEKARIPLDLIKTSEVLNELAKDTSLEVLARQVGYSLPDLQEDLKLMNFNWEDYKINAGTSEGLNSTLKTLVIALTIEQYDIIQQAFSKVKKQSDLEISEARCLELICADYIAGK